MAKVNIDATTSVDQIMVDEAGNVSVRTATIYKKGSETVGQSYHRHVLHPGDDLAKQDERVARIAKAAWMKGK